MQERKRKGKYVILAWLLIIFMMSILCFDIVIRENGKVTFTEEALVEMSSAVAEESKEEEVAPSKEDVLAAREWVLDSVSEEDIDYMRNCIKIANLQLEQAHFYSSWWPLLNESDSLAWNYIVGKGEVQVGWAIESDQTYDKVKTDLSEEEFMQKYGTKVVATIEYSADDFIIMMDRFQEMVYNESLKEDFAKMREKMRLAKETHEKSYLDDVYHILHDLDYFLFRYGPEDVGKFVKDDSTVCKYYGTLHVYER